MLCFQSFKQYYLVKGIQSQGIEEGMNSKKAETWNADDF